MNFRFFDDLVGSASAGASQEFRFREGKYSAKNYSPKAIEKFLDIKIFLIFYCF